MSDKEVGAIYLEFDSLVNDAEALCRMLEEIKAWAALTKAESLKKDLLKFSEEWI